MASFKFAISYLAMVYAAIDLRKRFHGTAISTLDALISITLGTIMQINKKRCSQMQLDPFFVNDSTFAAAFDVVFSLPGPSLHFCSPEDCEYPTVWGNWTETSECSCRISCYVFGSCCLNFENICLPTVLPSHAYGYDKTIYELASLNASVGDMATVVNLRSRLMRTSYFTIDEGTQIKLVNRCPSCYENSSCHIKTLCESDRVADLKQLVPLIIDGIVYRNEHCAICNSIAIPEAPYVIQSEISCNSSASLDVYEYFDTGDTESVLSLINSNFTCDVRFRSVFHNFDDYESACDSYTSQFGFGSTHDRIVFKNAHCALCNGFNLNDLPELQCVRYENQAPLNGIS
ncbi:hypothetical protein CAPTEDRAFT_216057 [Capitella teleta]|uniref:SMB domain-containing protein n=1 Tax=Capitella teleta TaxID=283909 RepID=R7TZZ3_CAPTE|nr:hypothetical protein CAPTEDRAFT_216057 [Capitella teleta]|eukprot:ELT96520.1 hypothetical protein CAPTEDRAFT_216057 [Capitella teleta]